MYCETEIKASLWRYQYDVDGVILLFPLQLVSKMLWLRGWIYF